MHQKWSAAFEARIRNWAGISRFDARGMIGGRRVVNDGKSNGPFYRYNFFEKQVYFSAYHIAASTVKDYLNGIQKYHVKYMTGYAMSNFFLARFIEEMDLKAPTLKAVITSSEKLTPEMRNTFKRVYDCKTYDSYSGVEACGLISECEQGSLHISPDVGIFEIIKEDGTACKPGETGEVVSTGLINYDQPLIRYRIGDLVRLSNKQNCMCGRNMPVIDEIIGRIEDTVIGKDGREIVRFHGVFIDLNSIIEGQIIQHELDEFEVKVVVSNELTQEQKNIIEKRMCSQLGEIKVTIHEVPFIPRNANGKFKSVISKIKRDR
jgi:phenylacetate-CoA ligase